jgi:transcription-repair coupling factor (superfamily II helicase)
VHLDHGIARYAGLEPAPDGGGDVLVLEFANDARLFVPLDQAWQALQQFPEKEKREIFSPEQIQELKKPLEQSDDLQLVIRELGDDF